MLLSNWASQEIHLHGGAYILKAAKIPLPDADKTDTQHYLWGRQNTRLKDLTTTSFMLKYYFMLWKNATPWVSIGVIKL